MGLGARACTNGLRDRLMTAENNAIAQPQRPSVLFDRDFLARQEHVLVQSHALPRFHGGNVMMPQASRR